MKINPRELLYASNLISLLRIVLAIPVVMLVRREGNVRDPLVVLLSLIVITDWLDGWLARRLGQVSELGKMLDPLADKIVMAVVMFFMVFHMGFPLSLVALVLFRDVMLVVVGLWVMRKIQRAVSANFWGKLNTFLFAAAIILFVFLPHSRVFTVLAWACYTTTIVSGIFYYRVADAVIPAKHRVGARVFSALLAIAAIVTFFAIDPPPPW